MRYFKYAILAIVSLFAATAWAGPAEYPDKPVTVIVPFAAGGPTDTIARVVATSMDAQSGKSFVIENLGGAGSTIGTAKVARAKPDGYTLLWGSSSALVIAPHLYAHLAYDPVKSFEPVGRVASTPYVLMVRADSPYKTYEDLIAGMRKKPGSLNFGSPGEGTSLHLTLELMLEENGVKAVHVPFKGGAPAMQALLGGYVQFLVDVPSAALPMIKSGRVRALAVTSATRLPELPDTPTLQELGLKNFESQAWFAVLAPRGTPAPIVEKLQKMLRAALKDPKVVSTLDAQGFHALDPSPAELSEAIERESKLWGKVIKSRHIQLKN